MNKTLVFGSVGFLGVSGAVTGISYTSLNLFQKKDLIQEFKSLEEEIQKSLEKIRNMISNNAAKVDFAIILINLVDFEIQNNEHKYAINSRIANLKKQIESKNLNKDEKQDIFKEIESFILLVRKMNQKINELKDKEKELARKANEIKVKFENYRKDYSKNHNQKELEYLFFLINDFEAGNLHWSYLEGKDIDFLEKRFLIKKEVSKNKIKYLISKNENFKNIKEDLEDFLNLSLELERLSFFLSSFNDFLSHRIRHKIERHNFAPSQYE